LQEASAALEFVVSKRSAVGNVIKKQCRSQNPR
jgi:hypothetical protein